MVRLPFMPNPYPDEILGSWISRVALLNGSGAWRALLEATGNGRRIEGSLFDVIGKKERYVTLFKALGYNFENALMELTTLPYWLAFSALETSRDVESKQRLPTICGPSNYLPLRGQAGLGVRRPLGESQSAKICPICLAEDVKNYGEAYWHRAHHLPNVFTCYMHGNLLQNACLSCREIFAALGLRNIAPPKIKCTCGRMLSKETGGRPSVGPAFARLAKFSVDALNNGPAAWTVADSRAFIHECMPNSFRRTNGKFHKFLEASYKLPPTGQRDNFFRVAGNGISIQLRDYPSMARSPECCAFFAALNIGFQTVRKHFTGRCYKPVKVPQLGRRQAAAALTIHSARRALSHFKKNHQGRPISACRKAYWFLRLFDNEWLKKNYLIENSEIPSIVRDRKAILAILDKYSEMGPAQSIVKISACAPAARCQFRDCDWIQKKLRALESKRAARNLQFAAVDKVAQDKVFQLRAERLMLALDKLIAHQVEPVRATGALLGKIAGLSASQACAVIKRMPQLQHAISEMNVAKPRRQVECAIREMLAENVPLWPKSVLRRAKLPTLAENFSIVRDVCERINK